MKFRWIFFLFFCLVFISSCTIEKRHYRNGFYCEWNHNTQQRLVADHHDTLLSNESDNEVCAEEGAVALEKSIPLDSAGEVREEPHASVFIDSTAIVTKQELPVGAVEVTDDPKPESHDRLNPKIAPMMIGGVVFSLLFLLIDAIGIAGSAPYFFILAPLIGVLLFAGAMLLRNSYVTRAASGEKSEGLRLSAHFHRFRIMLLLFFAGALAMTVGWSLAMGGGFTLVGGGILAVILGGSGMIIVQGVGAILLILALIYLLRWRKDPTGYKPRRNPHPRKDS